MFLKLHIHDPQGNPVAGVPVTVNDRKTGYSDIVYSDGAGYGDCVVATEADSLLVLAAGPYRITTSSVPDPRGPMYYAPTDLRTQEITLNVALFKRPFQVAPRRWKGNMCGVRVPGVNPVPGGSAKDPLLVLSWLFDRYSPEEQFAIMARWAARGYTHVLLSWPDSRAFGRSPEEFAGTCQLLIDRGFFPAVMLYSKDYDPSDFAGIMANIEPVLPHIIGLVPVMCVGWELSISLSPATVDLLIRTLCPRFIAAAPTRCYVHFQEGYSSFQRAGGVFADFWNQYVGLLTGVLHQKLLRQTKEQYRGDSGGLVDVMVRFAGQFGVVADSGFGHPFDIVAFEITASNQYNDGVSEADGDALGTWAVETPGVPGPLEMVVVQGSGNGEEG